MSTYSDVQNSLAALVTVIGDSTSGYLGNPFLKSPNETFTTILSTMAQELVDAGGELATTEFFDAQIAEYAKLVTYVEKLTERNRDEQIHSKGDDFYLTGVGDVTQTRDAITVNQIATDKILDATRASEASVVTTDITTVPNPICIYTTTTDYEMLPPDRGIMYLDLYAEKTAGEGDLSVWFHVSVVSAGGSEIDNLTHDETLSIDTRKAHATLIPATLGLYRVYGKVPTPYTPLTYSSTNRLKLTIYAFTSTGTASLKFYTNGSKLSKFRSTITPLNNNLEYIQIKKLYLSGHSYYRDSNYNMMGHSVSLNNGFKDYHMTAASEGAVQTYVTIPTTGVYKLRFIFKVYIGSTGTTSMITFTARNQRISDGTYATIGNDTTVQSYTQYAPLESTIHHVGEFDKGDKISCMVNTYSSGTMNMHWTAENEESAWFIQRIK